MAMRGALIAVSFAAACLLPLGCGSSGKGSPGSDGLEGTNMQAVATVEAESYEVDVCTGGDLKALADISAEPINPSLPDNTLYLRGYEVSFASASGAQPDIAPASFEVGRTLPLSGMEVAFVDETRKQAYLSDVSDDAALSQGFPLYTAKYVFTGVDSYETGFSISASFSFAIGMYSDCLPSVSPSSVTLEGVANPDSDPSDNLKFHISGGAPPYTVYSDHASLIEAPGALGEGVGSFTIDPGAVDASTAVTLTVIDSRGGAASAAVEVTAGGSSAALAISPSSISLSGVINPDSDPSDDVTFHISGGAPPYTVYTDHASLIEAPGALSYGTGSFTIDPDEVSEPALVTLSVVDSVGASATAAVTLNP